MNGVQPFLYIDVTETADSELEPNTDKNEPSNDPLELTEEDKKDIEQNGISVKDVRDTFNFAPGCDGSLKKRPEAFIEIADGDDENCEKISLDQDDNDKKSSEKEMESHNSSTEDGNASSTETMSSEEEMNEPYDKPLAFFRKENDGFRCNSCEFRTAIYDTVVQHVNTCHLPRFRMVDERNFQTYPASLSNSNEQGFILQPVESTNTDYLYELSQQLAKQCFNCPFCTFSCVYKEQMAKHIGDEHAVEIISQQYCSVNLKEYPDNDDNQTEATESNNDADFSTITSPDSNQRRTRAIQFDSIAKEHSILARILEERQQENQNRFACELCDFKTGFRYSIISHFETRHGAKRVYSCDTCHYLTHSEYFLKRHSTAKHSEKKVYKCKSCDYSSARRYTMRSHIDSVHKKIKPYPCSQCKYSAARKDALKTHIAAVHEGKRPFSCNECTFSSSRKYLLKNHVKSFHGPDSNDAVEKMFTCGVCGLGTKSSQGLKEHLSSSHGGSTKSFETSTHDGKTSYACDLCNFKCHRRTNLYSHRKAMHAGPESSRRHPCPFCFYFAYKLTGLKGHITKCHKDCSYSDIDRIINAR